MDNLRKHEIVTDVWPSEFHPSVALAVNYKSGAHCNHGNHLTPTQVKDEPQVQWKGDDDALYTLCMMDPDAPSRSNPKFREWHHWLIVNIPGHNIGQGDVLSEYVGAGPPQGTGYHRYVFFLFKQPDRIQPDEPRLTNTSGEHRGKFSVFKFSEKYKLGSPIGCDFFEAQWDDYVSKLYEQLSGKK